MIVVASGLAGVLNLVVTARTSVAILPWLFLFMAIGSSRLPWRSLLMVAACSPDGSS